MPDFSVVAEAGVGSVVFVVMLVVKRSVLGLGTDVLDASDGVVVPGVAGLELIVPGVPTTAESKMGVAGLSGTASTDDPDDTSARAGAEGNSIFSVLSPAALPFPLVLSAFIAVGSSAFLSNFSSTFSIRFCTFAASDFCRAPLDLGEPRLISLASFLCFFTSREAGSSP